MKFKSLKAVLIGGVVLSAAALMAQGPADKYPFTKGRIVKIDSNTKQIAVNTPHGAETFEITDKTYLIADLDRINFDRLKVGDSVKLNYYTNDTGRALIRRLKIDYGNSVQPDKTK